jgi:hypothetical protein
VELPGTKGSNFAAIFLLLFLSACNPFIRGNNLDQTTREKLKSEIKIYDKSDLLTISYTIIEPIQATSCKKRLWDPPTSREDAIDQLRYKTEMLGGSAIINLLCEPAEGMNIEKNCLSSITCYGAAIKVSRKI